MNLKDIGENIRIYRQKRKMTQQELAKQIGVTWEMVSRYERGVSSPFNQIDAISKALNLTPVDLLQNSFNASAQLTDTAFNKVPIFTSVPPKFDFKNSPKQYYYVAPDWMVKRDPELFMIDPSIVTIKSARINRNGPLYISPAAPYERTDLVLHRTNNELFVESAKKLPENSQVIGAVIAQETRFTNQL